jgi:hypothetical protein
MHDEVTCEVCLKRFVPKWPNQATCSKRCLDWLAEDVKFTVAPAETRVCLSCDREFKSTGRGNRICKACRRRHSNRQCDSYEPPRYRLPRSVAGVGDDE